jgi:hypothetical protein
MKDYGATVSKCDALIREGFAHEAAQCLEELNLTRIPNEWRLPIAKIARRCGLYHLGLKTLAKVIDNDRHSASASEVSEYAVLLIRIGAVAEGFAKLQSVNIDQAPESLLYRAFGHFGRWEFAESVPLLQKYLTTPLSDYDRLVGKANLAFAQVECRQHEAATKLLNELVKSTRELGHMGLLYNCQALQAQIHIQEGDYSQAEGELKSIRQTFPQSKINDHFLVTKWLLILEGLKENNPLPFDRMRNLAAERCDWVALREAEFFSLKVHFDEARFLSLLFGTPYASFRERINKEFARASDRSLYVLGPKKAPRFDLRTGTIDGRKALRPGEQVHQMTEVLLRDFYEPLRTARLFSELFPGELFNVSSTPARVRKSVQRARQWYSENKIPVLIIEDGGFYSLRIDGDFSFLVPLDRGVIDSSAIQWNKFCEHALHQDSFSNKDVCTKLNLSVSAAQSLINWAIGEGLVSRFGESKRNTRYKFSTPVLKSA